MNQERLNIGCGEVRKCGTQTHQRIENVLRKHKHYADRRRGDTPSYNPGETECGTFSTRDFRLTEWSRKIMPKYIGPCMILNKINDVDMNKLEVARPCSVPEYARPFMCHCLNLLSLGLAH
ncbi:hypothetical protein NFI96_010489 [Prochilodus magdalenae]|nr:hypothetical protein NFI96_010489 [Prochilodus magdalenae]